MNPLNLRQRRNRLMLWGGNMAIWNLMPPDMQFVAALLIVLAAMLLGKVGLANV